MLTWDFLFTPNLLSIVLWSLVILGLNSVILHIVARRRKRLLSPNYRLAWLLASVVPILIFYLSPNLGEGAPVEVSPLFIFIVALFIPIQLLILLLTSIFGEGQVMWVIYVIMRFAWLLTLMWLFVFLMGQIVIKLGKSKALTRLESISLYLPLISTIGLMLLVVVLRFSLLDICQGNIQAFHDINAHLKEVCSQSRWQTECPRSGVELYQFAPSAFDGFSQCGEWTYDFDSIGRGTLMVKSQGMVYISDERYGPDRFKAETVETDVNLIDFIPSFPDAIDFQSN